MQSNKQGAPANQQQKPGAAPANHQGYFDLDFNFIHKKYHIELFSDLSNQNPKPINTKYRFFFYYFQIKNIAFLK
jgi:hypothetical protein